MIFWEWLQDVDFCVQVNVQQKASLPRSHQSVARQKTSSDKLVTLLLVQWAPHGLSAVMAHSRDLLLN